MRFWENINSVIIGGTFRQIKSWTVALMKSLHKYQKMDLKRFARIREWEVKIKQGIPGIRNLAVSGKLEKQLLTTGDDTN